MNAPIKANEQDAGQSVSTGSAPHLIVVAHSLAPGPGGPEAIVNARLVRALAEHWPAGVSVISAGGVPGKGRGWDPSSRPGWNFHIGSGSIRGLRNRQSFVYRCINRAVFELTGDGLKGQGWMRFATRALRMELDAHPGAVVYSRVLPHTSLEAVRRVRCKRKFRWIVNINDPLPPDIWPGQYGFEAKSCGAMRRSLNKSIPLVDAFTFPCTQLRSLELKAFDGLGRVPTAILPHLPGRSDRRPDVAGSVPKCLKIAYAGGMRGGRVRPEFAAAMVEFVRREPKLAEQMQFLFYLTNPNRFALEFIKNLPFSTSVSVDLSPEECDEALLSADVLLDITENVDTPLLMTKIATYVGLNRPVWAVCGPGGTTWNLVQRGWGYASDAGSPESIYSTLRQIAQDWSDGVLWRRRPPALVMERFCAERQIGDLLTICQHLAASGSSQATTWPDSLNADWP